MATQPQSASETRPGEGEPVVVFEDVSSASKASPFSRIFRFELRSGKRECCSGLPAWERACC